MQLLSVNVTKRPAVRGFSFKSHSFKFVASFFCKVPLHRVSFVFHSGKFVFNLALKLDDVSTKKLLLLGISSPKFPTGTESPGPLF